MDSRGQGGIGLIFLYVMVDDADAVAWLRAKLANGLITTTEFGAGVFALAADSAAPNADPPPSQRVSSERRIAPLHPAATPQVSLAPLRLDFKTKRKSPPHFRPPIPPARRSLGSSMPSTRRVSGPGYTYRIIRVEYY